MIHARQPAEMGEDRGRGFAPRLGGKRCENGRIADAANVEGDEQTKSSARREARAGDRSERKRGVPGLARNQRTTREEERFQARSRNAGDTRTTAAGEGRQNAASR